MDYINLGVTIIYGLITMGVGVYVYRLGRKEGIRGYLAAIESEAMEFEFDDEVEELEHEEQVKEYDQIEEYVEPSYDDLVDMYVEEQKDKGIFLTDQQIKDLKNVEEIV